MTTTNFLRVLGCDERMNRGWRYFEIDIWLLTPRQPPIFLAMYVLLSLCMDMMLRRLGSELRRIFFGVFGSGKTTGWKKIRRSTAVHASSLDLFRANPRQKISVFSQKNKAKKAEKRPAWRTYSLDKENNCGQGRHYADSLQKQKEQQLEPSIPAKTPICLTKGSLSLPGPPLAPTLKEASTPEPYLLR